MNLNLFRITAAALIAFTTVLALSLSAETQPKNLITNPGFEQGLASWKTKPEAVFSTDTEIKRTGKVSAKITVPDGIKLEYQQISYVVPVTPGETMSVGFWMRCDSPTDAVGPYGAIEFLNGDQRVFVKETAMPNDFGQQNIPPGKWCRLEAFAVVPEEATSMKLSCIMHSHGTAWFDDAEILRIGDAPSEDFASVTLTLKPKQIITDNWQGFGAQGDLFLELDRVIKQGLTPADKKLVYKRISDMKPKLIRLSFGLASWEPEKGKVTPDSEGMRDLKSTLKLYKEIGADIALTEWGYELPIWTNTTKQIPSPEMRMPFAQSWASLLKYLRYDCGFSNLKYIILYNEPNNLNWEGYSAVYRAMDKSLKDNGLRKQISIVGPDETGSNWLLPRAVQEMDDIIDYYDAHNYTSNTGKEFKYWVKPRIDLMPKLLGSKAIPPRKRFLVMEFGMGKGSSTYANLHNGEYYYGLFLADSAIVSCNEGVSGMAMWCLMDTDYYTRMKWGLWKFLDEKWTPRPGFYSWSLLTKYIELGSTVNTLTSNAPNVASVAFKGPDNGKWTLLSVNRANVKVTFSLNSLPADSRWQTFIYSKATVPTADKEMLRPSATVTANKKGILKGILPANSFVLWHQVK
jgi:alpha-galactosidase